MKKYVYIVDFGCFVKVGITKNKKQRLNQLRVTFKSEIINFEFSKLLSNADKVEGLIISELNDYHLIKDECKGECFSCGYDFAKAKALEVIALKGIIEGSTIDKEIATSIRIPESLKKKVEEKAKEEGRTLNNMLNQLLKRAVQ
ncbi:Arc-like repressor [Vibrio phage K16]